MPWEIFYFHRVITSIPEGQKRGCAQESADIFAEKKMRWHIDYFLAGAKILQVFYYFNRIDECIINAGAKENLRGSVFIKKFGSSDCCCPGHLIYVKGKPFYDKKAISG